MRRPTRDRPAPATTSAAASGHPAAATASGRPAATTSGRPAAATAAAKPGRPRRLAEPRPADVRAADDGHPEAVDGRPVEAVRESWLVEDRWWTDAPLRRRYWEIVTDDGRNLVAFRDLERGRWYTQR